MPNSHLIHYITEPINILDFKIIYQDGNFYYSFIIEDPSELEVRDKDSLEIPSLEDC